LQEWSDSWGRLFRKINTAGHCRIFGLCIKDGEPNLSQPLSIEYSKYLKPNSPANSKQGAGNLGQKHQCKKLVLLCRSKKDFTIKELQVLEGLPHRVIYQKEEMV